MSAAAVVFQYVFLLLCVWMGSKGSINPGLWGIVGIMIFTLGFQLPIASPPWDVIQIIMCVIVTICCIQIAGGMQMLVDGALYVLQKRPAWVTFLAPMVTFLLTLFTGTGNSSFAAMPVIIAAAKSTGIPPSRPLAIAVVGSQLAICASPISAAMIALARMTENCVPEDPVDESGLCTRNFVSYPMLLAILIPSCLVGILVTAGVCTFLGKDLENDEVFLRRVIDGRCDVSEMNRDNVKLYIRNAFEMLGEDNCYAIMDDNKTRGVLQTYIHGDVAETENVPVLGQLDGPVDNIEHITGSPSSSSIVSESRSSKEVGFDGTDINLPHHRRNAKISLWVFGVAVLLCMVYSTLISESLKIIDIEKVRLDRTNAICAFMLAAGLVMIHICRTPYANCHNADPSIDSWIRRTFGDKYFGAEHVVKMPTFVTGFCAVICVFGVAVMSATMVNSQKDGIANIAGDIIDKQPIIMLTLILIVGSALLYSQGVTVTTLFPIAISLGVQTETLIGCFPACAALFILPTYPTCLAAIEMDDTGSTRVGKFLVNHSFLIPGMLSIIISVVIASLLSLAV